MSPLWRLLAVWLLLLGLGPGVAMAQTQDEAPEDFCSMEGRGREVEHRVEARVEGDRVHLTVLRSLHNPSKRYAELRTWFELPLGGTVHGFALESQGQWTEGVLLAAPEVARRYEALRRRGTAAPRTLATLLAADERVELNLWNVPPGGSVTVRYEVRLRLAHAGGRSAFFYPLPPCERDPRPSLTVAHPPGADLRIEPDDSTLWRELLQVSWKVEPFNGIDARAGLVPWGPGMLGFLQVRAGRLSEVPTRARVLFVVDASHSVGARGLTQQLARAGDYLQLLPDSVVEVVLFRRSAERLFGRFIPASDWKAALAAIPAARLETGNGSHLDEGLRLAQQVLAEGGGPARVLVLTDGQLRQAFEPIASAPSTSAPDVAVHLLWFTHRVSSIPLHEKLSGPLVREACGAWLPSHDRNLEPLARPVRLEQVHLEDEQGARLKELGTLEEGTGLQTWLPSPQAPLRGLVLRGQRWGCPSSLPVEVEPALSEELGRTAYAWSTSRSGLAHEKQEPLPAEVVDLLAASGDWVSPARSFLVVPPGAGPSSARTRAYPEGVEGGVAGGVVGSTILCPVGSPRPRGAAARISEELTRLLQPVLSTCSRQGGGASLQVRVETTGDEIVEVEVMGATSETQAACVREATWALRLPPLCQDGGAGSYTVTLSPPGP